MNHTVIPFNSGQRLLARARAYLTEPDKISSDPRRAVLLFFNAFKIADEDLKLKIVLALGSIDWPQVVRLLHKLMHDGNESESIRYAAAIQISILGGRLAHADHLIRLLKTDLHHDDPFVRASAALALGWEHNHQAVPELIACLTERDTDIQQAAVNALTTIGGERLLGLLVDHLVSCTRDQKRLILYTLNRFRSNDDQVAAVYDRFLRDEDPELRYDALLSFDSAQNEKSYVNLVAQSLQDTEPHIRKLALDLLKRVACRLDDKQVKRVRSLIQDADPSVRQSAIRLIRCLEPKPTMA